MLLKVFAKIKAKMRPDPVQLKRQAVRFVVMSVLVLLPLWAINLHLSFRGFTPALPGFIVEAGQPVPGNGDFPDEDDEAL